MKKSTKSILTFLLSKELLDKLAKRSKKSINKKLRSKLRHPILHLQVWSLNRSTRDLEKAEKEMYGIDINLDKFTIDDFLDDE